jgi:hypothetical protein
MLFRNRGFCILAICVSAAASTLLAFATQLA